MSIKVEEIIKTFSTRQLLGFLDSARACGIGYDPTECGCYFLTIEQLKEELATREHIPNKRESKIIRQNRAKYRLKK